MQGDVEFVNVCGLFLNEKRDGSGKYFSTKLRSGAKLTATVPGWGDKPDRTVTIGEGDKIYVFKNNEAKDNQPGYRLSLGVPKGQAEQPAEPVQASLDDDAPF